MLREAVDLRGGVNGDGEPRRQVSPDEVSDDLEDCIMLYRRSSIAMGQLLKTWERVCLETRHRGQMSEAFFPHMWRLEHVGRVLSDAFRTNFSGSGGSC